LRIKEVAPGAWMPPVVLASALEGKGIDEIAERIEDHRRYLEGRGLTEAKRKRVLHSRVRDAFMDRMEKRIWDNSSIRGVIEGKMEDVYAGRISPSRLVRELEERFIGTMKL
jgi:LAO/AO transport system kinase